METSVCIAQKGTVEHVTNQFITVRVHREASCGQCGARTLCYMGEGTERVFEIRDFDSGIQTGDQVAVQITRSMGNKAVVIGYLLPFILMISVMLILNAMGYSEGVTGLLSLSSLIPYYLVLYLIRNRLRKTFAVSVRK